MGEYLVEVYVSRDDGDTVERGARLGRQAAEEMTHEGTPVQLLRSIFVPEDETCLYLFEAASADIVREAARRSELSFERVVETAVGSTPGASPT